MTVSQSQRLETLYRVSQALNSKLELDVLLEAAIDQVIAVTGAERGFIMLKDPDGELMFQTARGIDGQTIESPEFEVSRSVIRRVASQATPVVTNDAQREGWLADHTSVMKLGLRSLMCVPLTAREELIGVVYVDNRVQAGLFTQDELALLEAVANAASVAIENARLHALALRRARLERELEVARDLQSSLIPLNPPSVPGFEIAGLWQTAQEVAGDFYDFIQRPDGQVAVVIGDVTDKGIPAALFMALSRTSIRASLTASDDLERAVQTANRLICADSSGGMFVTLYCLSLDPRSGVVECVCAGHNPPLLVRSRKAEATSLPRGGFPLGIEETASYTSQSVELEPGDAILLYTDGVTDATNSDGDFFGLERLIDSVQENIGASNKVMLRAIQSDLAEHVDGTPAFDDITLVMVKYEPSASGEH